LGPPLPALGGDAPARLDVGQALVEPAQEADVLLDVLPSRRVRQFPNRLEGHVFGPYTTTKGSVRIDSYWRRRLHPYPP